MAAISTVTGGKSSSGTLTMPGITAVDRQGTMDMAVPIWIMIRAPSKLGVILLQSTPTCASCSSEGP